jgi:hypothetical protein
MYLHNHFQLPENVMVLDSNAQRNHLLVNKEPDGHEEFSFPDATSADKLLINLSRSERPAEPEFTEFLQDHSGKVLHHVNPHYRILFAPFSSWLEGKGFALKDQGAEVREMTNVE